MKLANPDARRALRSIIEAIVALALLALLYWLTYLLSTNAAGLIAIARGALLIVGLGTLFYGAENVSRAIKISGPAGFGAEFGDATPVQVVNKPSDPVPTTEAPPGSQKP